MASETGSILQHLTDLGETRARTAEYESSTRRRDTLLPYEAEKKSLDNDTARLVLAELDKDVAYNDIVRENKITDVSTVQAYYKSRGPEGLLADLTHAKSKETFENRYDIMVASNDLILNEFGVIHAMAEKHFSSVGDPNYDSSAGLNQLESMWDRFTQKMVENEVAEQRPGFDKASGQQTEEMVWGVAMLPGGRSQNEPLSASDLPGMDKHLEIMKEVSRMGKDAYLEQQRQAGLLERQKIVSAAAGDADAPDTFSPTELSAIVKDVNRRIMGSYPQALKVDDDTGNVTDKEGYEHGNTLIRDYVTGVIDQAKVDPRLKGQPQTAITDAAMQHVRESVQTYEGRYDPSGLGDWSYNTYIPTKESAERMQTTQAEYIAELEAMIKKYAKAKDSAQVVADAALSQNFTNMVTADPGQ